MTYIDYATLLYTQLNFQFVPTHAAQETIFFSYEKFVLLKNHMLTF